MHSTEIFIQQAKKASIRFSLAKSSSAFSDSGEGCWHIQHALSSAQAITQTFYEDAAVFLC
jgi:plastocyanin domain-containing protein